MNSIVEMEVGINRPDASLNSRKMYKKIGSQNDEYASTMFMLKDIAN